MPARDTEQVPRTEPSLEDEGVPDLEGPLHEKELTGDAQEGLPPPGDRPGPGRDFGVTAAEQRATEPHGRRLLREQPDNDAGGGSADGVGRIVEPESEVDAHDTTKEAVARDVGDRGGLSAEEQAMRETQG